MSYEEDFELFSLLCDIIVSVADRMRIAPGEAASNQQNFDTFWTCKQEKLEVMCRQCRQYGKPPNLYFTTAPAEWKHNWHRACNTGERPLGRWRRVRR